MTAAACSISVDRAKTAAARTFRRLGLRALAACVISACGVAFASLAIAQGAPASATASGTPSGNPSMQGPTQAELDNADLDPASWLTSNKGYLGYRYSKLDQINANNIDHIGQVCSHN